MATPDVSLLICTWNRAALLRETLDSIARLAVSPDLRWEVVVVDNNSTDDTAMAVQEWAASHQIAVRYVFEGRQGKSWAMNAGLQQTTAPVVAFVDDDVQLETAWLQVVVDAFRDEEGIGYVGGPVAPIWEEPYPEWFPGTGRVLWGTLAILDYGDESFLFEERRRIPLGANFAIRRALTDRIGGFDVTLGRNAERVLLGQELPEFFARARAIRAVGRYLPGMRVRHHVPARRLRPAYFRRWWYGKGVSRARMEARHPVTELGLDLRVVPTIGGIPRFLFGDAARDMLQWCRAIARRDQALRYVAETHLCYCAGQIRERLRGRRRPVMPAYVPAGPRDDEGLSSRDHDQSGASL